ncbi:LysR family transcriptional regulator [Chitinasiproducens palmae]|uniref:DNA-binding transcriptional regulator, LysR family n=1 Tax=Chitinasiproducens palmae TaxID=1770053 RepID=A0A1H2PMD0_9BURK|nr:LysR substrate-binding domain-containing protein [Chitinasiproducens palmae]SDV47264.1 DNA-binding transcriptional regulator, LysR family [Chitinasiproducens palmae]
MESPDKSLGRFPELASLHAIGSRLKFRQLKLLIAIEDMGSVHRAAELLHMSQPGVSKALKEIEDAMGTTLFARSPQGLIATEMGRCAIRHARLMCASLAHMHEELGALSRGNGLHIAIGTVAGALAAVLANALLAFRRAHPEVRVDLYEDTSAHLLEQLQSGAIDIALCRTSVATHPGLFHFEWLCNEVVGVAASPSHPLTQFETVTLAQASQYPWILFPSHMPLRTLLEREAASQNVSIHSFIETSSTFATALMVHKSHELLALLSGETIDFFERSKVLRRIKLQITSSAEPYGIVTRAGFTQTAAVMRLRDFLRACSTAH